MFVFIIKYRTNYLCTFYMNILSHLLYRIPHMQHLGCTVWSSQLKGLVKPHSFHEI